MGDQPFTRADLEGFTAAFTAALNALSTQVAILANQRQQQQRQHQQRPHHQRQQQQTTKATTTTSTTTPTTNTTTINNKIIPNRGGGPIRVRGGNNRITDSTILSLDSLLFDAESTMKIQAEDTTVTNSISKIEMEIENPNEIAELQSEVERMNALTTTEKLKAEFVSKASVQYETKVQESQKVLADATFYARTKVVEAALHAKKKEAEGIVTLGNNYTSEKGYMMINGGMFQEISKINAEVVCGLKPKISVWNNGGDNSVASGKLKDAFPSCTWAIKFFNWHKGNCYIFQIKPSMHFTQWDPGGWSLVHWRSQHA